MISTEDEYLEAMRERRTLQKRINRFAHDHTGEVLAYSEAEHEELTLKIQTINKDIDRINELADEIEEFRRQQNKLADTYNQLLGAN